MNYSKNIRRLAKEIVFHYGNYNSIEGEYTFDVDHVPSFDLNELAAQLMLEDESLASEATGADNLSYKNKMLPALLNLLKNPTDQDSKIEFCSVWKREVTNYFSPVMNEMFQEILDERNKEEVYEKSHKSNMREATIW